MRNATLPGMRRYADEAAEGDARKMKGIEQALKNERAEVRRKILEVISYLADGPEFTADTIRHSVGVRYPGLTPHHANVWGAVIRVACHSGIIERTGQYTPSDRAAANSRMIPVYRKAVSQ
jgi:hypothetical protein